MTVSILGKTCHPQIKRGASRATDQAVHRLTDDVIHCLLNPKSMGVEPLDGNGMQRRHIVMYRTPQNKKKGERDRGRIQCITCMATMLLVYITNPNLDLIHLDIGL